MNVCVDSNVLIELLKQRVEATQWINLIPRDTLFIPGVGTLEVISGAKDKRDLAYIHTFMSSFEVVWHSEPEWELAYTLLCRYRLSTGMDVPDALIAATCLKRSLRLYTLNLKHFRPIKGLDGHRPYVRAT